MTVTPMAIPDVLLLEPRVFSDARGSFFESFRQDVFERLGTPQAPGSAPSFVQDNQSRSVRHVVRGLHYQIRQPQGKLVRVVTGEIFDVAVDMRRSSPTFGRWVAAVLSAENKMQLWIPPGFAHGLLVLSEVADLLYKTTDYYAPEYERTLLWNDPALGIEWPVTAAPILSAKDAAGTPLAQADVFA